MTFDEIIPIMLANKRVKRESWDNFHAYIGPGDDFVWLYRDITLEDAGEWCPGREDFVAGDWHEVIE